MVAYLTLSASRRDGKLEHAEVHRSGPKRFFGLASFTQFASRPPGLLEAATIASWKKKVQACVKQNFEFLAMMAKTTRIPRREQRARGYPCAKRGHSEPWFDD